MARLLCTIALATTLLIPAAADAQGNGARPPHGSSATRRAARPPHGSSATRRAATHRTATRRAAVQPPTTDPVTLSLKLAEQYWHGVPACGTPTIVTSAQQLPNSVYETVTSPEPANSVVEMWTEVQTCTITINASLWPSWRADDESFQWFCDAMTHEVGHLFGHPDGGQTNPALITYPFLNGTSPNFNSVPQCKHVALQYGAQEIRDEEIVDR